VSEPFLAEIRIIGFNFAPRSWAFCDGQLLPISQNQSLYSLLGTTYGGDGRTTFALPDMRGRTPIHVGGSNGTSHPQGQKAGSETISLTAAEMPAHNHGVQGTSNNASQPVPASTLLPASNAGKPYSASTNGNLGAASVANAGNSQGHNNMQPYLALNFCIALAGLFPSRN